MKAKTKTKALLMSLCAVLLVAASVLGTMAYLTDSETVNNTFTVGNVSIKLDEAKVDGNGNAIDKEGNPVTDLADAERVPGNEYKLLPNHTYTKDPTVTVNKPSVESYVRMKVTFNNASEIIALCTDPEFAGDSEEDIVDEDGTTISYSAKNAFPLIRMVNFVEANAAKWDGIIPDNMYEIGEMLNNESGKYFVKDTKANTVTFYYYYKTTVAAPTDDVKLATLFDSITVPEWTTNDQLAALKDFQINVVAEAIQADGFTNAADAWAHF